MVGLFLFLFFKHTAVQKVTELRGCRFSLHTFVQKVTELGFAQGKHSLPRMSMRKKQRNHFTDVQILSARNAAKTV